MAYIGTSPQNGVRNRFVYAATQGQKVFQGSDSDGKTLIVSDQLYVDLYQNGVKLKLGTDWSSTTTAITLVNAASVSDVIEIISFDVIGVLDTVPASTGGTFGGGISATTGTFSGNVAITGVQTITANGSHINLDTPSSGQNAWVTWKDNGAAKWEVNKSTGHDFNIYSYALSSNVLIFKPDGRGLSQFTAKAWVNFNGTSTVAIRDSHNVSSVTDNGTGDYTVNWDVDMANANYCMSGMASHSDANSNFINPVGLKGTDTVVAASCRLMTSYRTQGAQQRYDSLIVTLMAFGD